MLGTWCACGRNRTWGWGRFGSRVILGACAAWLACVGIATAQQVPAGFEAELIYQVPDVEHPSVVTCDDDGNLFVGEDPMDMRGPTTKPIDRVLLIRWDKQTGKPTRTVFCKDLAAVFGLVWHRGWLYVLHAPHYSRFRDEDGDGIAEKREELADGFGPAAGVFGFNDHIVTGTRLGLDGRVYVSVGDKGVPKATGKDGSTITLEGGGVVRMNLDGTRLEVFSSGTRNHLDVAMDSLDNIFTYDNTDDGLGWWTRFTHHVETGYYGYPYDYHPHADRHLPRVSEHGGGSPVGAACYREAAWPEKYRNAAFHCEWGKRKIQVFYPQKSGATFTATMEDFMVPAPGSEFRPQDVCFSPDGKYMYVADWNFGGWVNPAVVGRLYRVKYVGPAVAAEPPRAAANDSVEKQLVSLGHPAHSERLRAQFELAARGEAAVEPVKQALRQAGSNAHTKVHAVWTLNALKDTLPALDPTMEWIAALQDQAPEVRAQAARALGSRRTAGAVEPLCVALRDQDPTVRLQAAVALGRIGDPRAVPALTAALGESDAFVRFTVIQALRSLDDWNQVAPALKSGDAAVRTAARLALTGEYHPAAVAVLRGAVLEGPTDEDRAAALAILTEVHRKADPYTSGWWGTRPAANPPRRPKQHGWDGTPIVLATLREALGGGFPQAVRLAAVKAQREAKDPEAFPLLRAIASGNEPEALRGEALTTLGAVRDPDAVALLAGVAGDEKNPVELRGKAISAITLIGSPAAVKQLNDVVAAKDASETLVKLALEALASLKAKNAADAVAARLADPRPSIRLPAAKALASIRGAAAAAALVELLKDQDLTVRKGVIESLGEIAAKDAVPALLSAGDVAEQRYEVQLALSALPDRRALGLYLDGLVSKNQPLRDACRKALTTIRPEIEQEVLKMHERNELSTEVRAALQPVFSSPAPIAKFVAAGPFPDEKRPTFDWKTGPDRGQTFKSGDQSFGWKDIETKHPEGRFVLNNMYRPIDSVWVAAYAEIEVDADRETQFLLGSDDQMIVYVNGEKVYEFLGNRGWKGDQSRIKVPLKKGKNPLWVLCGNTGGGWEMSVRAAFRDPKFGFLFDAKPQQIDPAAYRNFALKNKGDAAKGEKIFHDLKGVGCVKCHVINGQGGKVGPDLSGVGVKYPREELIRSTLEPSNRILTGYEMHTVETVDGKVIQGLLKLETKHHLEIVTADGKAIEIPADEIETHQKSPLSLMPNGLKDGMTPAEFADLMAYLEGLKAGTPGK